MKLEQNNNYPFVRGSGIDGLLKYVLASTLSLPDLGEGCCLVSDVGLNFADSWKE